MNVAIITVSDSVAAGTRVDVSGDTIDEWVVARGDSVASRSTVPDESVAIVRALIESCDGGACDLVLTTGGTGLAARDVTPEATRAVLDAEAPGIAGLLRAAAIRIPRAALSRGVSGVRARTLIVNLPGSPNGVREGLATLDQIVNHACDVLSGRTTEHRAGGNGA